MNSLAVNISILFILLISLDLQASLSYRVGHREFVFEDKARQRNLKTYVWYPADSKAKEIPLAPKGPFLPVVAAKNAPLIKNPKAFPVILLSHGSMGLASRLFWLGQYFARQGAIVIAVDHPGNMFGDSSADGVVRVWDRAKDLSVGLDQVLKDPELGQRLDLARVSAAGHSVGGTTVLLLAGARLSFEQLGNPTPNCAGSKDPFYQKQCDQFKALDYKAYGKDVIEGDYSDSRIQSVVALDPGFARSIQPASIGKLDGRAFVFVADKLAVPQDEIYSKDFLKLLPASNTELVTDSFHMTFLLACKDGLPLEDDELKELCSDRDRKLRIQKEVAKESFKFFQKSWTK